MTTVHDTNGAAVVIGGGLAGLTTALTLAPRPVVLLSSAPLGLETSSILAQGGIAASIGPDDDISLHLADTLAAGDGLCDEGVAAAILSGAPAAIERCCSSAWLSIATPTATWLLALRRLTRAAGLSMPEVMQAAMASFGPWSARFMRRLQSPYARRPARGD